jgi:ankyrin repeat protein
VNAGWNPASPSDNQAIHDAAFLGRLECLVAFLKDPRVDLNMQDDEGNTLLMNAAQMGRLSCVRFLLLVKQADLTIENNLGLDCLHLLIERLIQKDGIFPDVSGLCDRDSIAAVFGMVRQMTYTPRPMSSGPQPSVVAFVEHQQSPILTDPNLSLQASEFFNRSDYGPRHSGANGRRI